MYDYIMQYNVSLRQCYFNQYKLKGNFQGFAIIFFRTAPANFEIVECTDISVTIAWDIPKSHECLEYEIEQRLEGSDKWETLRLLSANAETWKDGRLMYKLGDLSQDKWYKVRMCSVDNQKMKSHFTKPQSNKTLTTGMDTFNLHLCPVMITIQDNCYFTSLFSLSF